MRSFLWCASLAVLVAGCPSFSSGDGGDDLKPYVFLTIQEVNVIGASIKGNVTVNGCEKVTQVQLVAADESFILDTNFKGNPTQFEMPSTVLTRFYPKGGFALSLTVMAKVVCADGRANFSQAQTVSFFPAASVVSANGGLVLPESFVAEGGLGGTPTTFIGCVTIGGTFYLARLDANGTVLQKNGALPFNCTLEANISERSPATLTRWLMQPNVGAFAFDQNLTITNRIIGSIKEFGVGSNGSAVMWEYDGLSVSKLHRADVQLADGGVGPTWSVGFPPSMNAKPVIDVGNGWVYAASFQVPVVTQGNQVVIKYAFADAQVLNAVDQNGSPPVIVSQMFSAASTRRATPVGAFNQGGTLLYLAILSQSPTGSFTTGVLACATNQAGCEGPSRRWTSASLPGAIGAVVPYSSGSLVAAAGPEGVFFLSGASGETINLKKVALRATGSGSVKSVQEGRGTDFYVMAGGSNYPTEVIATDAPASGELWRLSTNLSGATPVGGVWVAVDDSGQAWLRVGPNAVKPLKNVEYRAARGPTQLP